MNEKNINSFEDVIKHIFNKKNGNVSELKEIISVEYFNILKLFNYIKIDSNTWKITKELNKSYKYIYSDKTSFFDKTMGYFCHYILRY